MTVPSNIPHGFCHCGCGELAPIARQTRSAEGYVRGEPMRFISNHHRRLSPVEYVERDEGYETPCWMWQRTVSKHGYARTPHPDRTGSCEAHIVFYERSLGRVPEGMQLDHLCRNRSCVNPTHLEVVTNAQNGRRGSATKLSWEIVTEMRELGSTLPLRELGERFGVGKSQTHRILRNECWREGTR